MSSSYTDINNYYFLMMCMWLSKYRCLNFTRKKIKHIFFLAILFIFSLYITTHTVSAQTISNNALPTNGNIASGSATITQTTNQLTINQSSDKLITNWSSFNIGRDATVQFNQPSSTSSALNRVNSSDPSYIFGNLKSNGQVFLINASGVLFGNGARVDTGALFASSLNIKDTDFLNNRHIFEKDVSNPGSVSNFGDINAFSGGTVAFIAPQVNNSGKITTNSGATALISGDKVTVTLSGNKLINYSIDQGTLDSLINNNNAIRADEGTVILSAKALSIVKKSVVNNTGTIEAKGITQSGGKIYLDGDNTTNSGTLSASAKTNKGGRIQVTGDEVKITSTSILDATGSLGGGDILIGGSYQNTDSTVRQAIKTTVERGALVNASADDTGDGGTIATWSDIYNRESETYANGSFYSKGGKNSGNGGKIETSGYQLNVDFIDINAGSTIGSAGSWLLDPYNYTIGSTEATTISTALRTTNVTVDTDSASATGAAVSGTGGAVSDYGDIFLNSTITKSSGSGTTTLVLKAGRNIAIANGVNITGSSGILNVQLWADSNLDGNGIIINGGNITTNGGYIKFGNGTQASINSVNTYVGGDVFFNGTTAQSLTSGNGAIDFMGETLIANTSGLTVSSGSGSVTFYGLLNSANAYTSVDYSGTFAQARTHARGVTNYASAIGDSYLANITSRLENSLASYTVSYAGSWIGGFRTGTAFQWVDGPEAGQTFYTTDAGGGNGAGSGAYNGAYINWNSSEPNNSSGEFTVQFVGNNGQWNDLSEATSLTRYVKETNLANSPLVISSSGTVTFSGAVGTSKALSNLTITSGALTAGKITVQTSGAISITNSGVGSITDVIAGTSASLTKAGSGTLTLSGTNTYSGNTTVNAGILSISADANLGAVPGSFNASSITLNGGTLAETNSGGYLLSINRGITLGASGGTISQTYAGGSIGISNNISGSGNLTLTSAAGGNIVFDGTNTYTGTTTISSGSIIYLNGILGTSGASRVYAGNITNNGTLLYTNSIGSQTLSGIISGTGAIGTMSSGVTLILSGTNIYTGGTLISTGTTLKLGAAGGISDSSAVTINGTGTLDLASFSETIGSLAGAGTVLNSVSGTSTLTAGGDNTSTTFSGIIKDNAGSGGTVAFTKAGTGTLTLSGANTYTGLTTISAGTLQIGSGSTIGSVAGNITNNAALKFNRSDSITYSGIISGTGTLEQASSATLTLSGANTYSGNTTISSGILYLNGTLGTSGVYAGNITNNGTLNLNYVGSQTLSGIISGVGTVFTINNPGVILILSGANTYTGLTHISFNTTIKLGAEGVIPDSSAVNVNGNLDLASFSETIGSLTGAGTITSSTSGASPTLTVTQGTDAIYSGVIQNGSATSVALTKAGASTLTLSAANTYTGLTTVSTGSLTYGIANAISTGAVTVNGSTAILALGIYSDSVGAVTLTEGSITGSGTLTSTSGFTVNPTTVSVSVSPILAGSVALTKSGTGTLTLSGANTYSGGSTISNGVVKVGISSTGTVTNGAFGTGSVTVNSTGAIDLNTYTVANALTLSGTGYSLSGALYNSHATSGATASGNITLAGATTIENSTGTGTLTLSGTINGAQALTITNNTGAVALNGDVGATTALTSLSISGASILGANVRTSGTQTYTGAVTLSALSPTLSGYGLTLTTTANTITFSSTVKAVDATDRDLAFGSGTGTVTFTGAVGTTFNLGTITNVASQQLTFSDAVTANIIANYGTLLFNATSAKTISPAITDLGSTTIQVINSANGAPGIITFSGNVAADLITIGTTTNAGSALFNGTVTGTNINIVGGDLSEASLGNFASTVTATAITLDDNTATASATFSGSTATITGTINGLATTEGIITVSGTGKTFASAIGGTNPLSTITISAGTTTFNSTVAATTISANAGTTITGAVTATTFGTTAAAYNIAINGGGTVTNAATFSNTGTLTLVGTTAFTGGVTATSPSSKTINGTITAAGTGVINLGTTGVNVTGNSTVGGTSTGAITLGAATLADNVTLTVGGGAYAANITLSTVTGTANGLSSNLTINTTGTASIGAVGTDIGTITVTRSGGTTFNSTVSAVTITLSDSTAASSITFSGNVTVTSGLSAAGTANAYNVIFNGASNTISGGATFSNTGTVTLVSGGGTSTFTGGVTATAPSQVNIGGTINSSNAGIELGDSDTPIVLTADSTISGNTTGNIILGGTIDGAFALTLNTVGDTRLRGAVGGTTALTSLTTNTGGSVVISGGSVRTTGTQTYGDSEFLLGANTSLTTTSNGNISIAGYITNSSAQNLTLSAAGSGTIGVTGTVGSSPALGILTISQSAGTTFSSTVNAATIAISDSTAAANITFSGNVTATGLTVAAGTAAYNVIFNGASNTIAGGTTFSNTGTVTLVSGSGSSTFTGGVIATAPSQVNIGGTVQAIDSPILIGDSGTPTVLTANTTISAGTSAITLGGTVDGGGFSLTITGNSSIGGNITNATSFSVSGTTTLGANVTTTTGGQTYSSAVTLTASPTLTAPSGTILFSTTVNGANTLTITNSGGANTGDVTFTGAVGGTTALTGLTITTDVLTAAAIKSIGTLSVTNSGASSITGIISNGASVLAVTKAGAGTLTLSGINTYTGDTTINAGTIKVSANNNLGTGNLIFNGGTLNTTDSFSLTGRSRVYLDGNAAFNVDNGTTLTVLTTITARAASATFTKSGPGTLILSSSNNRWYGTTNINAGSIQLAANNTLAGAAVYLANAAGIQLDLNNYNAAVGAISGGGTDGGNIILGSGNLTVTQTQDTTYDGVISGTGALTINGHRTLSLTRANTYSGGTNIGTRIFASTNALSTGNLTFNFTTSSLFLEGNQSIGNLTGPSGALIDTKNRNLTINQTGNTEFAGTIRGGGYLIKNGSGELTLSGTNSYGSNRGNGTTINAGSIKAGADTSVLGLGKVEFANVAGAQLDLDGHSITIGAISGGGAEGGNIILGSGNLTVSQTQDTTYSGLISGSGSTAFNGSMTINLNRSNTYTGGTNIGNARLFLLVDDALPSGKDVAFTTTGGSLFLQNAVSQAIRNINSTSSISHLDIINGNLNVAATRNETFSGNIVGTIGTFRKTGVGQLTINRSNLRNITTRDDENTLINM